MTSVTFWPRRMLEIPSVSLLIDWRFSLQETILIFFTILLWNSAINLEEATAIRSYTQPLLFFNLRHASNKTQHFFSLKLKGWEGGESVFLALRSRLSSPSNLVEKWTLDSFGHKSSIGLAGLPWSWVCCPNVSTAIQQKTHSSSQCCHSSDRRHPFKNWDGKASGDKSTDRRVYY